MASAEKLVKEWNSFIGGLQQARDSYENLAPLIRGTDLTGTSIHARRMIARINPRAKFNVALANLLVYWQKSGGLDALRIVEEFEEARKEGQNALGQRKESVDSGNRGGKEGTNGGTNQRTGQKK